MLSDFRNTNYVFAAFKSLISVFKGRSQTSTSLHCGSDFMFAQKWKPSENNSWKAQIDVHCNVQERLVPPP